MVRTFGVAAVAGLLATAAIPAGAQAPAPTSGPLLSLSATGEVEASPDEADVRLGVQTQAATAAEAFAANARQMSATLAVLRRSGVAERDVQTSGLSLSPQMDDQPQGASKLVGYQASNGVVVHVHDLARLGGLLDAVVTAGANRLDGVEFGLSNRDALADEARRKAVAALQAKADLYAAAAGYHLKGLRQLSEGDGEPFPPRAGMMTAMRRVATPVEPGQLTVSITVSGEYELTR